jgi:hypothetical protein
MAITRTQIAKQLLANGGRIGFRIGSDEGDVSGREYGGSPKGPAGGQTKGDFASDRSRNPMAQFTPKAAAIAKEMRDATMGAGDRFVPDIFPITKGLANIFQVKKPTPFDIQRRGFIKALRPQTVDTSGMDRGGDVPYWAQLGYSSEAEYLAALARASGETKQVTEGDSTEEKLFDERFRRFRAEGGRIGLRFGSRGYQGGATTQGGAGKGTDVDDRSTRGQTAVNEAAIMMARMQNQNKDRMTNPRSTEKFPITSPVFANFNKMAIDKIIADKNLEEEEEDQTITAGAVDASDLIRNMPEFKQKISDTVSGIMANPDIANLGKTEFAVGGLADGNFDFENARQMYGLGKLVKKVTRTVKKIAKSPIGKAALLYAGTAGLGSLAAGGGMGSLFKLGTYAPSSFAANVPRIFSRAGLKNILVGGKGASLGGNRGMGAGIIPEFSGIFGSGGALSPLKAITAVSALAGLMTPEQEEEAQELARGEGIDIEAARRSILNAGTAQDFRARRFVAEGGSMKEPVAKKTMPLLDMGGKEMDLRAEGGFVPIGRMEKADDVPARLSKNEFVFTADAVRNAGDGDVDKGAEVMYNMMKNLEAGGDVSEESQGLKGARKMFQTSQRLEEVL